MIKTELGPQTDAPGVISIDRLAHAFLRAFVVFGDADGAVGWMRNPASALK